jgi:hypothetical protein
MTQYIFMNHRVREKKPSGPVIVCQDDYSNLDNTPRQRESNEFELWHHGEKIGRVVFKPAGLAACKTHDVHAWVELDDLVIVAAPEDRKPKKPVAMSKRANSKVRA